MCDTLASGDFAFDLARVAGRGLGRGRVAWGLEKVAGARVAREQRLRLAGEFGVIEQRIDIFERTARQPAF